MDESTAPARGRGGPYRLGPLDPGLKPETRDLATCLRRLRDESGLSSEELAAQLGQHGASVEQTRMSKFLNGRELPSPNQVRALHEVHAQRTGQALSGDAVKNSQLLLYAAAQAERAVLTVHAIELSQALETLSSVRVESVREVSMLREDLARSEERCRQREEELAQLRQADSEQGQEIRSVTEELHLARLHIDQLQERIRHMEALLRLQDQESRYGAQLIADTEAEMSLIEAGVDRKTGAADLAIFREVPALDAVHLLGELRDEDRDAEADLLLDTFAREREPQELADFWTALNGDQRTPEADLLLTTAVKHRNGVDLYKAYRSEQFDSSTLYFDTTRSDYLITAMGRLSPATVVSRFAKSCRQRADHKALEYLGTAVSGGPYRSAAETERLMEEAQLSSQGTRSSTATGEGGWGVPAR